MSCSVFFLGTLDFLFFFCILYVGFLIKRHFNPRFPMRGRVEIYVHDLQFKTVSWLHEYYFFSTWKAVWLPFMCAILLH